MGRKMTYQNQICVHVTKRDTDCINFTIYLCHVISESIAVNVS
jgi:hypothetical protein